MDNPVDRILGEAVGLSPDEWARILRVVQRRIGWRGDAEGTKTDHWKQAPRIVLALLEERRHLPARMRREVLDVDPRTEAEMRKRVSEEAGSP